MCGGLRRGLSRPRRSTSPHDLRVHVPESCRRRHVDSNCRPGPRGPVSRLARPRKPNLRPFRRGMLKPSCRGRAMLMLRGFVPWGLPGPTRGRRRGDAASALENEGARTRGRVGVGPTESRPPFLRRPPDGLGHQNGPLVSTLIPNILRGGRQNAKKIPQPAPAWNEFPILCRVGAKSQRQRKFRCKPNTE